MPSLLLAGKALSLYVGMLSPGITIIRDKQTRLNPVDIHISMHHGIDSE